MENRLEYFLEVEEGLSKIRAEATAEVDGYLCQEKTSEKPNFTFRKHFVLFQLYRNALYYPCLNLPSRNDEHRFSELIGTD